MKEIRAIVEIRASSDPDFDQADIIFVRQFEISNLDTPLPDILDDLCFEIIEKEYPGYEYLGYKVLDYY